MNGSKDSKSVLQKASERCKLIPYIEIQKYKTHDTPKAESLSNGIIGTGPPHFQPSSTRTMGPQPTNLKFQYLSI